MSKTILLISSFILVLTSFVFLNKNKNPQDTIKLDLKNKTFTLEIANTTISRSQGLSNRDDLCPNCGMIFIYPKEGTYPFWMKNTRIPLDIIWFDQNGLVVDIKTGKPQDLSLLTNSAPAQYIIETNPKASSLSIGDTINLPDELN